MSNHNQQRRSQTMGQYALCMGVNDYNQFLAENPGWTAGPLPYSGKNAQDFAQLLVDALNFDPGNISVQIDNWCTRDNILNTIDAMIKGAQAGDVLCIFYSGHGTRLQGSSPS